MGKLNWLKGTYTGKVGASVGGKWKNLNVVRSYGVPAYTDYPAQHKVRANFSTMNKAFGTFTDQLKPYSALDTRSMTLRNALVKLNKEMISDTDPNMADVWLSRGGLLVPTLTSVALASSSGAITAVVAPPQGGQYSARAIDVLVVYNETQQSAVVATAPLASTSISAVLGASAGDTCHAWLYNLDYRGSGKVASRSTYHTVSVS
jgi:hypothetical protein